MLARVKFLFQALADLLFPPICYGCDTEIESGFICDSCRLLLFTSELDVCGKCGRPCLPERGVCGRCKLPFALSRVRAVGVYGAPFVGLIHALKYEKKTALVPVLGRALALLLAQDTELRAADAVCAVPLHPARLRERGYNQAFLLAQEVSRLSGMELIDPLVRRKNTPSQTEMRSEKERLDNVGDAFGLRAGIEVAGRRLVLVDDVMTTGATISAAGTVLLEAGAREVMGLVLAAGIAKTA